MVTRDVAHGLCTKKARAKELHNVCGCVTAFLNGKDPTRHVTTHRHSPSSSPPLHHPPPPSSPLSPSFFSPSAVTNAAAIVVPRTPLAPSAKGVRYYHPLSSSPPLSPTTAALTSPPCYRLRCASLLIQRENRRPPLPSTRSRPTTRFCPLCAPLPVDSPIAVSVVRWQEDEKR